MKLITHLCIPLLAMLVILSSCAEDEPSINSQVQFSVNVIGNDHQTLANIPDEGYFLISITNSAGEAVISGEKFNLVAGEKFVTVPLTLPPGNYKLTGLSLVDENSDLIRYAVPLAATVLGKQVTHALDFDFSIQQGEMSTFNFDLLDVSKHKPEDFGLATFKASRNYLKIMVHADGIKEPVTAEAFILQGTDTLDHYMLEAKMNLIALPGDAGEPYILWITKTGYASYSKQFTIGEIKSGKPWVVMLEQKPAFKMLGYVDELNSKFEFLFDLELTGTINVNWGDNSNDTTIVCSTHTRVFLNHFYPATGNYPITVTGDVDQITMFYSAYGQGPIDAVDFSPLVNLTQIVFGLSRSPEIIDLTHNYKLEFANLGGLDAKEILLPAEHNISGISITGPNGMSSEAVDAVINNIYANSVAKNITNGHFGLFAHWFEPEGLTQMVGPPSAAAVDKLRILQNDYGWGIGPEVPPGD